VGKHLAKLRARCLQSDYLTFVPDGEPTLDIALDATIDTLSQFGIPIAVVTNATLLWREEVRRRLQKADLVSVKVDSVHEETWRKINRPHRDLQLVRILNGIREFAAGFAGTLISESMLLAGINDSDHSLTAVAEFLAEVAPQTAYLAVPTRPTTVQGVRGCSETDLLRAYHIFADRLADVELLTGHETGSFAHTGDAGNDLLAIAAVHPMREPAVRQLLTEDHADWTVVRELLAKGDLMEIEYLGELFYLRPVRRI